MSHSSYVLILGNQHDQHAKYMLELLQSLGAKAEFLDVGEFPATLKAAFDPQHQVGHFVLPSGLKIKFSDIRSIYWRNYNRVALASQFHLPHHDQRHIAENDSRSLIESLLAEIPCRWVNGLEGYLQHQRKPSALAKAAAIGLLVPATIITNELEAIIAFREQYPNCIFKPVQGGAHTRRLTKDPIDHNQWRALSLCPVTIQEEIVGTNIRVFVIGDEVYGCEVLTEHIDFRDDQQPIIRAVEIPAEIQANSIRVARKLSLLWTGIDYRLTPDGRYYFLEANPSPMFLGFQARSGLPLAERLAALLLAEPAASLS